MQNMQNKFQVAAEAGSDCAVVIPKMKHERVLEGAGVVVELEEQFYTTKDLTNQALLLLVQYFPEHAKRLRG